LNKGFLRERKRLPQRTQDKYLQENSDVTETKKISLAILSAFQGGKKKSIGKKEVSSLPFGGRGDLSARGKRGGEGEEKQLSIYPW